MHESIHIFIAATGSLFGVLILALVAKLMAYAFGRPGAWERCFQVFLVLGIATLVGAMGLISGPPCAEARWRDVIDACVANIKQVISGPRVRARIGHIDSACVANLKQIEGAKAFWAQEMKKTPADIPLDADLFGPNTYIREKSTCPAGGTYHLGAVGEKPRCSLGGRHSLD